MLTAWNAAGAHRRDLDGNGVYDHAAAVALMDRWWVPLTDAVFDTLGPAVRGAMPLGRHDAPGPVGSAFIAGWYGIVHKDLRGAIAGAPIAPFSRVYCGNGVLAACRAAVRNSLAAAVASARPEPRDLGRERGRRSHPVLGGRHRVGARHGLGQPPDLPAGGRVPARRAEPRHRRRRPQRRHDNCPFVANPGQEDSGGLATSTPDGIGDACQCGDVTGNGIVNGQDANVIQRHGIGAEPNPLFVVPGNCDVTGNDQCNGQDANAVKRAALGRRARTSARTATTPRAEPLPGRGSVPSGPLTAGRLRAGREISPRHESRVCATTRMRRRSHRSGDPLMKPADRSLDIAVLGLGQAGGNIAAEFHRRGYRALAFNTAKTDLASLALPEAQRIYIGLEGTDGAGSDVEYGRECIAAHAERIRAAVAEHAASADVVVVAAGLGNGIGSCAPELVALLREQGLPVVVLTALPHHYESGITKVNALCAMRDIAQNRRRSAG